jgi:hypothetical protein
VIHPSQLFTLTVRAVRERLHFRLAEWHLAVTMTLCGFGLLQPGDVFAMPHYAVLSYLADEDVWGWTLLVVGALRLMALTVNGALPRGSPHLRALLAIVSCVLWSALLMGFMSAGSPSLMVPVTAAAVFTEFVNIYRSAGSARVEDERYSDWGGPNGRAS